MEEISHQLAHDVIFRALPAAAHAELIKLAMRREIPRGEFLCRQGEVWPYVLLIASGKMRSNILSVGGQEHTLSSVESGAVFLAHSFFDDEPMPASLAAIKDSVIYLWSRTTILPILLRYPESLWEINRALVQTMRRARTIIYGLAFQPVAGRLADFLLNESRHDVPTIERDWSLDELAKMVASTPEAVCRILHQFADEGLVGITRTRITLHDRDGLERVVKIA